MNVREILREAQDLVRTGWTQRQLATDAQGRWVSVYGDDATCFCALGAILRVSWNHNLEDSEVQKTSMELANRVARRRLKRGPWEDSAHMLSKYNDNMAQSVEDVISLFDEAMEGAQ